MPVEVTPEADELVVHPARTRTTAGKKTDVFFTFISPVGSNYDSSGPQVAVNYACIEDSVVIKKILMHLEEKMLTRTALLLPACSADLQAP